MLPFIRLFRQYRCHLQIKKEKEAINKRYCVIRSYWIVGDAIIYLFLQLWIRKGAKNRAIGANVLARLY